MGYTIYYPPPSLRKYIKYVWRDDMSDYNIPFHIVSSKFAEINPRFFFHSQENGSSFADENGKEFPTTFIKGVNTEPAKMKLSPNAYIIGICFFPYAINRIFDLSSEKLKDTSIDLAYLKSSDLSEKIFKANDFESQLNIIYEYFYQKIYARKVKAKNHFIDDFIMKGNLAYDTSLDLITQDLGLSRRHLERLFKEQVGISPKRYQSILRFGKVIESIRDAENLAELAFELNYADQSHFIKEFKKYSGITPKNYLNIDAIEFLNNMILEVDKEK